MADNNDTTDAEEPSLTLDGGESNQIEEGRHSATIDHLEVNTRKGFTYVDVGFKITDVERDEEEALVIEEGFAYPDGGVLTPDGHLGKLWHAATGEEVEEGHSYDLTELEGCDVVVTLHRSTDGYMDVVKEIDGQFKVESA